MIRLLSLMALATSLVLLSVHGASAGHYAPPAPPAVTALDAAGPSGALLHWRAQSNASFRLCVTADRQHQQSIACFPAGRGDEARVGIPASDNEQHLFSLQSCLPGSDECSQPVDAGVIGRRRGNGFDFYATALLQPDGRVRLSGFSNRPDASLVNQAGAPGRPENRRAVCAQPGETGCPVETVTLTGALAGVSQELPGGSSVGITFQMGERPHAALLFDDGTGLFTGGKYTAQTILDEYGVKGTFFLIGRIMRDNPGAIRALVAAGHRVGNHSFSHPSLTKLTDAQIGQELDQTEAQFRADVPGGSTKPCFRAPNGEIDARVLRVANARGYQQINWTATSVDWSKVSSDQIIRNVRAGLFDGALISFHTQEPQTMTALRTLIPLLQSWGYVFDLVC